MVSLVNPHRNASSKMSHLLEIDLKFARNSTPGWFRWSWASEITWWCVQGGRQQKEGTLSVKAPERGAKHPVLIMKSSIAAPTVKLFPRVFPRVRQRRQEGQQHLAGWRRREARSSRG